MAEDARSTLAEAVASHGLPGTVSVLPSSALDATMWAELSRQIERHALVGVLAAAVDDGTFAVDPAQRTEIEAQFEAHMVACLALERTLVEVDEVLVGADVAVRVLKGPALAHSVALDPRHRTFGDIDLLCPSDQFDRAVAALVGRGARRRHPELAPGYDHRFAKSVTLEWGTHEVDLHRTLAAGPFGLWIDEDSLWADPASFRVAGRSFATFDRERHLVHACYHAVLGDIEPRLASLRDIALLTADSDLDGQQVRSLAAAWRGDGVVAQGLVLAGDRLGVTNTDLETWARGVTVDRQQRRALEAYRVEHRRFARQSLATFRALSSWGDRLAFTRAVVWPSPVNLEARGLTRRRHLLRR